jgi:hypothetical protein
MNIFKRFFIKESKDMPELKRVVVKEELETSVRAHDMHDYIVTIGGTDFIGNCGYWRVLPDFYKATYEDAFECTRLLKKAQYEGKVK